LLPSSSNTNHQAQRTIAWLFDEATRNEYSAEAQETRGWM
jgi:hypothetical protein